VTQCGERIIATEDHPFYTPNGMVPLTDIEEHGLIAVFPFEGVITLSLRIISFLQKKIFVNYHLRKICLKQCMS